MSLQDTPAVKEKTNIKKRELSSPENFSDPKKNKAHESASSESDLDISDLADTSILPSTMATEESLAAAPPHIIIPDSEMTKLSVMLKDTFNGEIENLVQSVVNGVLKGLNDKIDSMEKNITDLQTRNTELVNQNVTLTERVVSLKKALDQAEQYSRRNNLRISGINEETDDNTDVIVMKMASDIGCDLQLSEIDRSHRVGKPDAARTKPREILVKFTSYRARQKLYKKRTELKDKGNNGVFLNEDLTRLRSKALFEARRVVKADSAKGAWSSDGTILIKDYGDAVHRLTSADDLSDIDFPAKPVPPAPEPMD